MKVQYVLAAALTSLMLAGCSSNHQSQDKSSASSSSAASHSQSSSSSQSSSDSDVSQVKLPAATAIKTYQKTFADSQITDLSVERELGKYQYEIDGVDDNHEHTLKLDANSGKILIKKSERLEADEANGAERQDALDLNNVIGLSRAVKTAQPKAKGQTATEASIDKESEQTYWEIQFEHQGQETSVKLNAQTGRILTVDTDD
ncbi:peptidase propeptide and YPEB domain protein [Secundilactobacillus pentosiphilus]|uniref:Peptidase propeptide and YPEB domain protein n=1 Tax=Secundilactobacillus pentosiphilus TaxID=1714682 RepID=A0A1Z5IWE7_9LACO|nr:PepSY domain-containing protein [Secundilactobacillus pentosiphilus]GAX06104.1 peptidase propeptide and YPEB domain protein [Secundilactobacillus pentosiphilus]